MPIAILNKPAAPVMFAIFLASCATVTPAPHSASIVAVSHDARVCLAGTAVQPGKEVRVYRKQCKPITLKSPLMECRDELVAAAHVVEAAGDGCITLRTRDHAFVPRQGDRVQVVQELEASR